MSLNVQSEGKLLCCFGAASLYPSLRCKEVAEFRSVGSSGMVWCAAHAANFITSKVERLMPRRIVLSRKKGWRMPPGTVKVDRTSRWGNPFRVGDETPGNPGIKLDAKNACLCFWAKLEWMEQAGTLDEFLRPLRGMDLACWCKEGEPCHADVLLEWVNREEGKDK